ncbi:phosphatidylinositol glycan anchor biosynthesis class U protein-like [Quillaja saponaria]|uniref:Phosphatidylinositol glycan anchor biosynthesis class U protein-like n=1 Tax=Quillaja saponaria TaxID=32244 RepID=A0AAD7L6B2_QUISA|nr:phosphatidylinositol glycan anchor biosynthesis class U protein-like [Quillaja saponaria]
MTESRELNTRKKQPWFWIWVVASIIFRLILIYLPKNLNLSSRPEVSTPLTSIRRLAEGYWLRQSSMSPYAGSMYHGSPLLLSLIGQLTVKRIEGQPNHLLCSDLINAKVLSSVGDSALYLGLLGLFANELADVKFSFLLFCGYVAVSLLSPVMHNLWIWRGTGNANFYFGTAMAYAFRTTKDILWLFDFLNTHSMASIRR